MGPGEGVAGELQVIKLGAEPTVDRMTALAGGREIQGDVTGILRFLVIRQVAGRALGRKALELADGGAFVAGLALDGGMSADQGEAVLVFLDGGKIDLPTFDGVALLAIGAKLSSVDVGVAIGAILPHVGEDPLQVALRASNLLVHATEGVTSLVVVKLGDSADGAPAGVGVAILTRDSQGPVRTAGVPPLS